MVDVPIVTITKAATTADVGLSSQKVLIVGQMLSGTKTAGTLVEDIQNDSSWEDYFGSHSMLAGMVRRFKSINTDTQIDALPLADNGSGTASSASIKTTGAETVATTYTFNIMSSVDYAFELTTSIGQTAEETATALAALINANTKIPCTAAVNGTDATKVDITASHKGTTFNDSLIEVVGSGGQTFTIVAFSGGAGDPVLTGVLDEVGDIRYQHIVFPSSYDYDTFADFVDDRWNVENAIKDGTAYTAKADTLANVKAAVSTLNSQSFVQFVTRLVDDDYVGPATRELPYISASEAVAIISLRLTSGSDIADYIVAQGSSDLTGGPALASLPYMNTPLSGDPIDSKYDWTNDEAKELSENGCSVIGNNYAKTGQILGYVVTTYLTDSVGNASTTRKYLNTVQVESGVAEYIYNNARSTFLQTRLSNGNVEVGRSMVTETSFSAWLDQMYDDLAGPDYVYVSNSDDDKTYWQNNKTVSISLLDGSITFEAKYIIVVGLRKMIGTLRKSFSAE